MSPGLVGAVGLGIMLLLMFLGVPIAISMGLVGKVGYAFIEGTQRTLDTVSVLPYATIANYLFSVLPVFLLMGEFADISGMMRDSYRAANTWLGQLPGGLAMASIAGAALFSAVSGSSMACAALMTRISLPTLLKYKYHPRLATGALAAGGTLGNLIPPGTLYVFYAMMSETSIGKLYVASMIPGIVLALMYLGQIYIQCKLNPSLGPPGVSTTLKEKVSALKYTWAVALLFILVMGGIILGVFTATEAGSIGAIGAFLYAFIRRTLNGQNILQAFRGTTIVCGMAFAVIIGVNIFTRFITISGLPQMLADWLVGLNIGPTGVIIFIMVVYFVLGTAMDAMSMILTTLPIFITVLSALGVDLYWFGVLVMIQIELSNITPPTGLNIYVVATMVKDKGISIGEVFWGCLPFSATMLVFNALLIAFPQIALFLPRIMK